MEDFIYIFNRATTSDWVRTSDVLTKMDYESSAFNHSATDVIKQIKQMEPVGFEPTCIKLNLCQFPTVPLDQVHAGSPLFYFL